MVRTARRRRKVGLMMAAALMLAACSAAPQRTVAAPRDAPAAGAVESAGRIVLSTEDGAVVETWPRVAGAQHYMLTATGAATVTVPGNRITYRWPALHVPSDLTTATVAPRRFTVAATAHGTVVRRLSSEQDCASLVYVAARGSGQNGLLSEAYASGLGSRGAAVLADLRTDLRTGSAQLPAIAVDYPATAVAFGTDLASLAQFLRDYGHSVAAGVADTVRIVTRTAAACRHSRFVLFGYSQGAQVIGSAYAALPAALRDRIADVILFADAQYRPADPRVRYLPTPLPDAGILGARETFPGGGPALIQSWCWSEDVVCQRPPTGSQFHGSIYDRYQAAAARLTARELR